MSPEFPSPRTWVCHQLLDGFTSCRHFHCEAEVDVNHQFLALLGITSGTNWSLPGSLGIVWELPPSEMGFGRSCECRDTQGTPARDISQFHSQRMDTPEAAPAKQGMVSMLASWWLKILPALSNPCCAMVTNGQSARGMEAEEKTRLGHFVNPLDM